MRITKAWLREVKRKLQEILRDHAKMGPAQLETELRRIWPSFKNDDNTTPQHMLAILIDIKLDHMLHGAID